MSENMSHFYDKHKQTRNQRHTLSQQHKPIASPSNFVTSQKQHLELPSINRNNGFTNSDSLRQTLSKPRPTALRNLEEIMQNLQQNQRNSKVDQLGAMREYDEAYSQIFNYLYNSQDQQIDQLRSFCLKNVDKLQEISDHGTNVDRLINHYFKTSEQMQRLNALCDKYKHSQEESIEMLIKQIESRKRRSPNNSIIIQSEIEQMMKDYNINVNFKEQVMKDIQRLYPCFKNDTKAFFNYKNNSTLKSNKEIVKRQLQKEKREKYVEELEVLQEEQNKPNVLKEKFEKRFKNKRKRNNNNNSVQLSSVPSRAQISSDIGAESIHTSRKFTFRPEFITNLNLSTANKLNEDKQSMLDHSLELNESRIFHTIDTSKIKQKSKFKKEDINNLSMNQSINTSRKQLSPVALNNKKFRFKSFMNCPTQAVHQIQINEPSTLVTETNQSYSTLRHFKEPSSLQNYVKRSQIRRNKNHLNTLIEACNEIGTDHQEDKHFQTNFIQAQLFNDLRTRQLNETIDILKGLDTINVPGKVVDVYAYNVQAQEEYKELIREIRHEYLDGKLDPVRNDFKVRNQT